MRWLDVSDLDSEDSDSWSNCVRPFLSFGGDIGRSGERGLGDVVRWLDGDFLVAPFLDDGLDFADSDFCLGEDKH